GITELMLDHYPGMTEQALQTLGREAAARWSLGGVTIIHRVGKLAVGDSIVFVGTAAAHRREALEACAFLIDQLKMRAPFWKKERFSDGHEHWVEARASDDNALARWT
ncbi:MAG: molybdenum cofactor biosynthesis protein MoaE, partial [Alphaproteobacteria bacterium]|nr:molybdenum cofactor biosynthesis protein MoaE [Alphaproteobacteria bacterium]